MFPLQPFNEDPPGPTSQNDKFIIREYLNGVIVPALNALNEKIDKLRSDHETLWSQLASELSSLQTVVSGQSTTITEIVERLAILEEKVAGLTPCPDNPPDEEEPPPPEPDPDPEPEPDPPTTPTLALSKTLMTFIGVEGTAPSPASDTSVATNSSNGVLNTPNATVVDPDDIVANVSVNLTAAQTWDIVVTPTNPLPPAGVYNATVSVDSANNAGPAVAINIVVSSDITPPPPPPPPPPSDLQLVANPTSLSFSAVEGGTTPAPKDVDLVRTGTGTLNDPQVVNITDPDDIVDTAVITPDAPQDWNLRVTPKLGALVAGIYAAIITVASVNQINPPIDIDTQLLVSPPPPAPGNFTPPSYTLPNGISFNLTTGHLFGTVFADTGTFDSGGLRVLASPQNINDPATFTIAAGDAAGLQAALDASASMDWPVIQVAVSDYTLGGVIGFRIRKRTGIGYCVIRTGTMAGLPARGTGVDATHSASMAKITPPQNAADSAIQFDNNAGNYWFAGIEFKPGPFSAFPANVISMLPGGAGSATTSFYPHHIVFERCYFHGTPNVSGSRRPVAIGGENIAFEDCYYKDIQYQHSDSQCFAAWGYTRNLKVVGNETLTHTSETILLGGARPGLDDLTHLPQHLEFRRNRFAGDKNVTGGVFKNLLEIKWGRYILFEGNDWSKSWAEGQEGFAWNIGCTNGLGSTNITTSDITFMYNRIHDVAMPFILAGAQVNVTPGPQFKRTHRVEIRDNLFYDLNIPPNDNGTKGSNWCVFLTSGGIDDAIYEHCTSVFGGACRGWMSMNKTGQSYVVNNFRCANNIAPRGQFGLFGSGEGNSTWTWATIGASVWDKNIVVGTTPASPYPAGTIHVASNNDIDFESIAGDDYRLKVTSPYHNFGTDGKDIGANVAMINAVLAGV